MAIIDPPFEIHVHGDVPLRADVTYEQLQDALKPLWAYTGAKSLAKGAQSVYEEEPGIRLDDKTHVLHICWTTPAEQDFRHALDELCMNINELAATGAAIEVGIYDVEFDEDDEENDEEEARDDFLMLFVGPTPQDIMQVQRDMLVDDICSVMERHFEREQLGPLVSEIDQLFNQRYNAMMNSLAIPKITRGTGGPGNPGGHGGGGRKPRHLH